MKISQLIKGGITALKANVYGYKAPLGVYIHLTESCNLNCVYCDYNELAKRDGNKLTADFVIDCIDKLAALGTVKLNLTGGEPLLIDGIGRIIDFAKNKGMFVVMSSNGLLIKDKIDEIKNLDLLMISFDGTEAAHDSLRGKGTHKKVMGAMEILRNNNIKFFTTTVLNTKTSGEIDYIVKNAENFHTEANFTLIQFLPDENNYILLPSKERISQLIPTDAEIRGHVRRLIELKESGKPIGSTMQYLEFLLKWEDYNQLFSSKEYGFRCWAGSLYCHLYADGKLYSCGHCIGAIEGQDVLTLGVKNAFNRLKKLPNCNSCRVACDTENSLIYSLNPGAIYNWLRYKI